MHRETSLGTHSLCTKLFCGADLIFLDDLNCFQGSFTITQWVIFAGGALCHSKLHTAVLMGLPSPCECPAWESTRFITASVFLLSRRWLAFWKMTWWWRWTETLPCGPRMLKWWTWWRNLVRLSSSQSRHSRECAAPTSCLRRKTHQQQARERPTVRQVGEWVMIIPSGTVLSELTQSLTQWGPRLCWYCFQAQKYVLAETVRPVAEDKRQL